MPSSANSLKSPDLYCALHKVLYIKKNSIWLAAEMAPFLTNALLGFVRFMNWDSLLPHLPLMGSPLPIICIVGAYLLFVLKIGPGMLKHREPYNIRKTIITYNLLQIVCNIVGITFIFLKNICFQGVIKMVNDDDISLLCTPMSASYLPTFHYLYLLLKIVDLVDTIFFVLRKKFNQITFLHLYHHVIMVIGTWCTCKYLAGGHLFFLGFVNCIVHFVMYFYYFLTSWDSAYKGNVWWKKHLTQLQITQHFLVLVSFVVALCNPYCTYPKSFVALICVPGNIFMIYLFSQFYIKTYIRKEQLAKTAKN